MEQEILKRLSAQEELLQLTYASAEKTRKYFMWTFYMSLVFFVLPLLLIMFALPTLLSGLGSAYGL